MSAMFPMRCRTIVTILLALTVLGCGGSDGPELGQVEGTIKLDGEPLKNANVIFQPEKGRPSTGTTDEDGHYELQYTQDKQGAVVGKHTVKITTFREADPDAEDASKKAGAPERIPAKYNVNSELTADVAAGSNDPKDFELKSGGKIIKPGEEDRPNRNQADCE